MDGSQRHDTALWDKHVAVVGCGYGGITVTLKLQGKCKITFIDPKEAFHHCFGALRSCTEDVKDVGAKRTIVCLQYNLRNYSTLGLSPI